MDTIYDHFWDFAQDYLPYSVYDALYTFSGHFYTAFSGLNSAFTWAYKSANGTQNADVSLLEQTLSALLSIIAIYFGIISIYRTAMSFIRTTVSIVKWAIIIALLAMGAGFFAARGPVDTGMLLRVATLIGNWQGGRPDVRDAREARPASTRGRNKGEQTEKRRRPSILEPFLAHDEWKNGQAQAEDTQEYIKRVVDGAQKVIKDGSGFLDILFKSSATKEDGQAESGEEDTGRRQTRAQTRRRRNGA